MYVYECVLSTFEGALLRHSRGDAETEREERRYPARQTLPAWFAVCLAQFRGTGQD